jgi:hypothetical protein
VTLLEQQPDPREAFLTASRMPVRSAMTGKEYGGMMRIRSEGRPSDGTTLLDRLPKPVRLALEMAAHEDIERRAMEGELSILERAWKEAEQIAAIADSMFLPAGVDDKLASLKAPADKATSG